MNTAWPDDFKWTKIYEGCFFFFQIYALYNSLTVLWHSKTLRNYNNFILDNKTEMLSLIIKDNI